MAAKSTGQSDLAKRYAMAFFDLALEQDQLDQLAGELDDLGSLMRESDEFVRGVTAKQFIVASGLAMAVATFWGFGESFAGAPHMQTWLIVPLFWGMYGLTAPFIRTSR